MVSKDSTIHSIKLPWFFSKFRLLYYVVEVLEGVLRSLDFFFIEPIVAGFLGTSACSLTTVCRAKNLLETQELAPWECLLLTFTLFYRGCHFPRMFLSIAMLKCWILKLSSLQMCASAECTSLQHKEKIKSSSHKPFFPIDAYPDYYYWTRCLCN